LLDEAIESDPTEPWFYQEKGTIYYFKGEIDKSIENFNQALELDSNSSGSHALLARLVYSSDSTTYDLALKHINKAIQIEPENDHYHIDRAYIYLSLKNFEEANKEADYILSLNDFDRMAAERLKIETLYKSGNTTQLKAFIVEHDLSNEGEFLGTKFCLTLASIYHQVGEPDKACKLIRGAAEPYLMMEEEIPDFLVEQLDLCK
jgi:tetratricopeptide (TPR) repeat protein